jgi:homoserine dehydrogenase
MILMKDSVNIGLIGFGTIRSGVVETFNQNPDLINDKVQKDVKLKTIVDLDITTDRGVDADSYKLSTDVDDILDDPEIDIIAELMGS